MKPSWLLSAMLESATLMTKLSGMGIYRQGGIGALDENTCSPRASCNLSGLLMRHSRIYEAVAPQPGRTQHYGSGREEEHSDVMMLMKV